MTLSRCKTALVLGGSRGIGAATVGLFSSRGVRCTFTYRQAGADAERLAAECGATAVQVDSGDRPALTSAIAAAGPIDFLVVSAGIALIGPAAADPDDVDRMIDVNVRGPYHAAIAAGETLRDGGRIVFIGSINGERVPFAGAAAYGMTKAALSGLARGLARDLGPRRITVNVIAPGPVDTDMNPAGGPMAGFLHGHMAIARHIRPDEIAALAWHLCSDAGAMMTGGTYAIDGGFAA